MQFLANNAIKTCIQSYTSADSHKLLILNISKLVHPILCVAYIFFVYHSLIQFYLAFITAKNQSLILFLKVKLESIRALRIIQINSEFLLITHSNKTFIMKTFESFIETTIWLTRKFLTLYQCWIAFSISISIVFQLR